MRITCWTNNVTNPHSEYVTLITCHLQTMVAPILLKFTSLPTLSVLLFFKFGRINH